MTIGDMTDRALDRLGDFPNAQYSYYTPTEIGRAFTCLQNVFVFLTLCFENTETFSLLTDGTASYGMLGTFPDWILPLRVRLTGGKKLQVSRLNDLAALDQSWRVSRGTPQRYASNGFDLLSVYQQPSIATSIDITYAQSCAPVRDPSLYPNDTPSIPAEYHQSLIEGAIPLLRAKEGGGEWEKVLPGWDRFTAGIQKMADYVRNRNIEQGYDRMPPELARYDMSALLNQTARKNG